jgi:Cu/Zn superoxide dismutase
MIVATTLFNHPNINGTVEFYEKGNKVVIKGNLKSNKYKNSTHGIHIHEAGDLRDNCMAACGHFNPYGKNHGGPDSKERHVGDLGNIRFDSKGVAKFVMEDSLVKLLRNQGKCGGKVSGDSRRPRRPRRGWSLGQFNNWTCRKTYNMCSYRLL